MISFTARHFGSAEALLHLASIPMLSICSKLTNDYAGLLKFVANRESMLSICSKFTTSHRICR